MKLMMTAVVLAASGSVVFGQSLHDAGGVGTGTNVAVVTPIAEGHILIDTTTTWDGVRAAEAGGPMDGLTGSCWGAMDARPPAVSGGGNCALKNAGGAMLFNQWTATGMTAEGAIMGSWTVIGGTGVYEGASGGGSFLSSTDEQTGRFENVIVGAMILK